MNKWHILFDMLHFSSFEEKEFVLNFLQFLQKEQGLHTSAGEDLLKEKEYGESKKKLKWRIHHILI